MPTNRKPIKTLGSARVVQVFGEIDQALATTVINKLVDFDKKSSKDILLLIDSPGGDLDALISITMILKLLRCDIATLALSNACSAASILLACGTKGKRLLMEDSVVMVHDVSCKLGYQSLVVMENEIKNLQQSKLIITKILEECGAKSAVKLFKPEASYLNCKQAIEYKLADKVINSLDELYKAVNI